MQKFLLSLAARYYNEEFIRYAVDFAKQRKASLSVLFVLDNEVANSVIEKLIDVGFIGEKPSTELQNAVLSEYEAQAKEQLREIKSIAGKLGVELNMNIKPGNFVDETVTKAVNEAVDLIILNRERQGAVAKLFKGSAVDDLIRNSPCEVKVFES